MSDAGTFERLIANLRSEDIFVRLQAAQELGALGDPRAVALLIEALDDSEWQVCMAAIAALGALGDERAAAPIERALHRDDVHAGSIGRDIEFAETAAHTLRQLGEPGFQALLSVLRDFIEYEFIGVAITTTLGEMAEPRSLDTLLLALRSSVYEVAQAAESVSGLGDLAVEPLVRLLGDASPSVRFHASQSLKWIGPSAIPALLNALESAETPAQRATIIETLGNFEDDSVLPSLREALSDPDADGREAAALALGDRGDVQAIEQLLLVEQRNAGLNVAALTLAQIGQPAMDALLRALADEQRPPYVRYNAACALGEIADIRALEPLIGVLQDQDEDDRVRAAVAKSLGQLKDSAAVEPLSQALADTSLDVRRAAIQALGATEDPHVFDVLAAIATDPAESRKVRHNALFTLGWHFGDRTLAVLREVLKQGSPEILAVLHVLPVREWDIEILLDAARDDSPQIRAIAFAAIRTALLRERDPHIVEFVAHTLTSDDRRTREQAALMLGRVGDVRAYEPTIATLRSPSITTRIEAARILAEIGDERALPALEQALAEGIDSGDTQQRLAPWVAGEARDAFQSAILRIRTRESSPIQMKEGEE